MCTFFILCGGCYNPTDFLIANLISKLLHYTSLFKGAFHVRIM